jgi:molybdopterin synthase sulfur carrier subunit
MPPSHQIVVQIPSPFRELSGGESSARVTGRTVREALAALVALHPALRPRLRDENGNIRQVVLVFLNSRDVRSQQGEDTPVADGDTLTIVPAIDGG